MKEAVTKVIDMLIQEDFHGAFQKLLELYKNALQLGEITTKGTRVSCVYYKKVPIRKKYLGTYLMIPVYSLSYNQAYVSRSRFASKSSYAHQTHIAQSGLMIIIVQ